MNSRLRDWLAMALFVVLEVQPLALWLPSFMR